MQVHGLSVFPPELPGHIYRLSSCPRLSLSPGGMTLSQSPPTVPPVPVGCWAGNSWEWDHTQQIKQSQQQNCVGPGYFRLTPSLQTRPLVSNRNYNTNIYFSSPAHAFKRETMRHDLEPAESSGCFPLALLRPENAAEGSPSSAAFSLLPTPFPGLEDLGRLLEGSREAVT